MRGTLNGWLVRHNLDAGVCARSHETSAHHDCGSSLNNLHDSTVQLRVNTPARQNMFAASHCTVICTCRAHCRFRVTVTVTHRSDQSQSSLVPARWSRCRGHSSA